MCGITGYITNADTRLSAASQETRRRLLDALLVANQDRGSQSTGIALIDAAGNSRIIKDVTPAQSFINSRKYRHEIKQPHYIAIGHTRLATVGKVTQDNAHPFHIGEIVGAHNGQVSNYLEVSKKLDVDSQAIFTLLNKHKNRYKKALKKLSGQFAVSWTYLLDEPPALYLVRDGNPLSIAYIHPLRTWFYSSELSPLISILTTYQSKFYSATLNSETAYRIKWDLKITKKKISFKQEKYTYPYTYNGFGYPRMYNDNQQKLLTEPADETQPEKYVHKYPCALYPDCEECEKWDSDETYLMELAAEQGCAYCQAPLHHFYWYDEDEGIALCTAHKALAKYPVYYER